MNNITEHPQRRLLAQELHARPSHAVEAPARVTHIAMMSDELSLDADYDHICKLCHLFKVAPPAQGETHFAGDLGPVTVRWERHTEFATYTFYRSGDFDHPFKETALEKLPSDWLKDLPGQMIAACHLAVEEKGLLNRSTDELLALFDHNPLTGSTVAGGRAHFWSDFQIHADGFTRALVRDNNLLDSRQAGRLVQRVFEIATYRMMSMLAFPLTKELRPSLSRAEEGLSSIIGKLADVSSAHDEQALLSDVTKLAADVEKLISTTTFRFNASRAYAGLVKKRLEDIREGRIDGLPPPGEFINRRLDPAMATCESYNARQQGLSNRIANASDLLRTRVDVALQDQNQNLLKSMDRRARVQLRLQQTVEGLSVVAISYYLVGLVQYLAKGAKAAGVPVQPDIAAGLALPVVLGAVYIGVRRLREALIKEREESSS